MSYPVMICPTKGTESARNSKHIACFEKGSPPFEPPHAAFPTNNSSCITQTKNLGKLHCAFCKIVPLVRAGGADRGISKFV